MGFDNRGIVEQLVRIEHLDDWYGIQKTELKYRVLFDLDFLGRDYTVAQEVFGWCKSDGNKEIPEDSNAYIMKYTYDLMDASHVDVIPGTVVLQRIRKLIADTKQNNGEIDVSWTMLEYLLHWYMETYNSHMIDVQQEGKQWYVRAVYWLI
jgi:hypothetical protein